jgi:hypothetical protein
VRLKATYFLKVKYRLALTFFQAKVATLSTVLVGDRFLNSHNGKLIELNYLSQDKCL